MDPNYWYRHLRHTVKLCRGFETLLNEEYPLFIEIGPGYSLGVFLQEIAALHKRNPLVTHILPSHHRLTTDLHSFFLSLGVLWQAGITLQWSALHEGMNRHHVPLPTYAFQKQKYWIYPDQNVINSDDQFVSSVYKPVWSHQAAYLKSILLTSGRLAQHSWIIFKDKTGIGDRFISLLEHHSVQPIVVAMDKTYSEENGWKFKINPVDKQHYLKLMRTINNSLNNPIIIHLASYSESRCELPSSQEINDQLTLGFYSLLYLTQAYIEEMGIDAPLRVSVITTGTQSVFGTEEINPINATLTGACRVIMQEHPSFKFRLIDLNPSEQPQHHENLLNKIVDSCLNDVWDETSMIVPYRDGYQWNLMHVVTTSTPNQVNRLKDNGIYLLTGGLGGIALSCCEAIVMTVSKPTFILLFRSQIPKETEWEATLQNPSHAYYEKIKRIRYLQSLGASFFFYQVDITDLQSLNGVVSQCQARFGNINGLIHAAGIVNSELTQFKERAQAHSVLLPKIHGTYNLIRVLNNLSLDFVILKSSLAALLGGFRQIDYCGANAGLDAFVDSHLFSFASFVISINWNTWREVGIAAKGALKGEETYIGRGNDISSKEGQELFLKVLQGNEPHIAISKVGINFDKNIPVSDHISSLPQTTSRQNLSLVTQYLAPTDEVECQLAQLWQETLGIKEIGINDNFFVLGGHSLKALSLIEKINKRFDCVLPATQIYRDPTIRLLYSTIIKGSENNQSKHLILLKEIKKDPPYLFLCHPISGLINCFNSLVSQSELPISIYGIQDPSIEENRMIYGNLLAMAEDYLSAIKKIQPMGPYFLIGYSFGGGVLYEVANTLQKQGEKIGLLVMIDSWAINPNALQNEPYFKKYFQNLNKTLPEQIINLAWEREQLLLNHTFSKTELDIMLFKASKLSGDFTFVDNPTNGWEHYNNGKIMCHMVEGTHESIIDESNSKNILHLIKQYLRITLR